MQTHKSQVIDAVNILIQTLGTGIAGKYDFGHDMHILFIDINKYFENDLSISVSQKPNNTKPNVIYIKHNINVKPACSMQELADEHWRFWIKVKMIEILDKIAFITDHGGYEYEYDIEVILPMFIRALIRKLKTYNYKSVISCDRKLLIISWD